jgi:hypothetical protein
MAVLSQAVRQQIWRGLMRYWSRQLEAIGGITKSDLQAAVNAADDWADTNATAYNSALPTAFRTNATANQKAVLLAMVVLARFNPALVRSILGEVD